jgi:hypothetical protein
MVTDPQGSMRYPNSLVEIDYLVFSSHKTATQSVKKSLKKSGLACEHCHHPLNIGLEIAEFSDFLEDYRRSTGERLKIISIFREPIPRHVSSFFQTHGWKPLGGKTRLEPEQTKIYLSNIDDLITQFNRELQDGSLRGRSEALRILCRALDLDTEDLNFDAEKKFGHLELDRAEIFILRFDLLMMDFSSLLEEVCKHPIQYEKKNVTNDKWYSEKYKRFLEQLTIPEANVEYAYKQQREIIEVMYNGKFEEVLGSALRRYCRSAR